MENIQAIVLAAGKATRFNTGTTKLTQKICGQEMVLYLTKLLAHLKIPTTLVVGYQKEQVMETVKRQHGQDVSFVVQEEQLGTGHALMCTKNQWQNENLLILNGDMPLIAQDIIQGLYDKHCQTQAVMSFVVAHSEDPAGYSYGRVIQIDGSLQIVEAKHFDGDPHEHCFVNAGVYIVSRSFLEQAISEIKKNEKSREFYLTDLVQIASNHKKTVSTTLAAFDRIRGVNDLQELWAAEQIKRSELIRYWMSKGVRFTMPQAVHLDVQVSIGAGTTIGGGVHLVGSSTIGNNCAIGAFSSLSEVTIGNQATIEPHCVISDTTIGAHAHIGPFAHLHNQAVVKEHAHIESFTYTTGQGSHKAASAALYANSGEQDAAITSFSCAKKPEKP